MTGSDISVVTGRGTGVDDAGLDRKIAAIKKGLETNEVDASDPISVLAAVGGFEIGVIAGLMLGAASKRLVVMVDGFITTAAALIAHGINPTVADYMIAGHRSVEPGHIFTLEKLGLTPILDLDLRLGEGSGAATSLSIVETAVRIHAEMATFEDAAVSNKD
jgi:nicotinate-nucleotide--dimethylbenzimidazole phosphoribosyltransferase